MDVTYEQGFSRGDAASRSNPMSILNMALLSIIGTVAHMFGHRTSEAT